MKKLLNRYKFQSHGMTSINETMMMEFYIDIFDKESDSYKFINIISFLKSKKISVFGKILITPFYLSVTILFTLLSTPFINGVVIFVLFLVNICYLIVQTLYILMTRED